MKREHIARLRDDINVHPPQNDDVAVNIIPGVAAHTPTRKPFADETWVRFGVR